MVFDRRDIMMMSRTDRMTKIRKQLTCSRVGRASHCLHLTVSRSATTSHVSSFRMLHELNPPLTWGLCLRAPLFGACIGMKCRLTRQVKVRCPINH